MGKTFTLTRKADTFIGTAEADTFTAPLTAKGKSTLGARDLLDGGKGVDAITATLSGASLAPALRRIETATFTYGLLDAQTLDLAKAKALKTMTLIDSDSSANAASVTLKNAAKLSSLTIRNDDATSFAVSGLSDKAAANFKLALEAASASAISLETKSGKAFGTIDLTLSGTISAILGGAALSADTLFLHTNANKPALTLAAGGTINLLKADGTGELTLAQGSLDRVKAVDVSALAGGLTATIGGTALTALTGSAGADRITLNGSGGTAAAKAAIALGDGDDRLTIAAGVDLSTVTIDGGAGTDTLNVKGNPANLAGALTGFETLVIVDATGMIDLAGAALAKLTLEGKAQGVAISGLGTATIIDGKLLDAALTATFNTPFSALTASDFNDVITMVKTPATGTAKATVTLGNGDDRLTISAGVDLAKLDINAGSGADRLSITGAQADLGAAATFEMITITDAAGTYDLKGAAPFEIRLEGTAQTQGLNFTGLASTTQIDASPLSQPLITTIQSGFGGLKGTSGNDIVTITSGAGMAIAGQTVRPDITLGGGNDSLIFSQGAGWDFSNWTTIDAGETTKDNDVVTIYGNATGLQNLQGFETLVLQGAQGSYSLENTGIHTIRFGSAPVSNVTLNGLADKSTIQLSSEDNEITKLSVAGTVQTELTVELSGGTVFGNELNNTGLIATNWSKLVIDSSKNASSSLPNAMSLLSLGSASAGATIEVTGDYRLLLSYGPSSSGPSAAATEVIRIDASKNTVGLSMSGYNVDDLYRNGVGITLIGSNSGDVLIASNSGGDVITSNGGSDQIYSLGGIDTINLKAGSEKDTIIYRAATDALAFQPSIETINNFGANDVISVGSFAFGCDLFIDQALTGGGVVSAAWASIAQTLVVDVNGSGTNDTGDFLIRLLGFSGFNESNFDS